MMSAKKKKQKINANKTQYDVIKKQMFLIYNNFTKIDEIMDCFQPAIPDFSVERTIGKTISLSNSGYNDDYFKMREKNIPFIVNKDDSAISIFYEFDENGNIIKSSMSYVPFEKYECYFRIDFNELKNESDYIYHPRSHMHISIEGDFCRIPMNFVCTPFDFLYLVYKYIYKKDYELLKSFRKDNKPIYLDAKKTIDKMYFDIIN